MKETKGRIKVTAGRLLRVLRQQPSSGVFSLTIFMKLSAVGSNTGKV
jgi:hypothetical protein